MRFHPKHFFSAFLFTCGLVFGMPVFGQKDSSLVLPSAVFEKKDSGMVIPSVTLGNTDSSAKKFHVLVLPVVSRSIETSWAFGAAASTTFHISKKDSLEIRTSNVQGLVLYSLKKQLVAVTNGTIYFPGEKYILSEQVSYSYYPDKFWGIGKCAADSNEEPYDFRQFYVYLHGQRKLGRHLFAGILYEYQRVFDVEYMKGGIFDKENVVGRQGYHVSGLGGSFAYDTRNDAFAPDKGVYVLGSFNHFASFFGSDYTYTNFVIDARGFLRTYKNQVLAMQGFIFLNNGEVPLRSIASLGGANSMRGYYAGRYRDNDMAVVQAEYRANVYKRLGVVAFGGMGNVGNGKDVFSFEKLKYAYGAGIRFTLTKSEKLNLRLDYGIAENGKSKGLYFQLGEAF